MKTFSITALSFLILGQLLAQEPDSTSLSITPVGEMRDTFFKSLSDRERNTFYTNSEKDYVFEVDEGTKSSRLILKAGKVPRFSHSDSLFAPTTIVESEKENTVQFSLPPMSEIDVLPLMLAVVSYEVILVKKLKEKKPSLSFSTQEKSCVEFVKPDGDHGKQTDSVEVCTYNLYEEAHLKLFNLKEHLCYKNHTTLSNDSGEYRLDHWFEPEEFGFVKFLLTLPDGNEWEIELVDVNENIR